MMRRIVVLAVLACLALPLLSQLKLSQAGGSASPKPLIADFGNSWYDPGLNYLKIRVWEDGVYRVTDQELINAGFSVSSASLANLKLFYRGEEQHIHVEQNSGNLSFIEFWGRRNDGRVDSLMYRDPITRLPADVQPHKRISLFSDTSAYFLTVANDPGLRMTTFEDLNYGNYTAESHYRYESLKEWLPGNTSTEFFNPGGGGQYDINHILNSAYITGEGYLVPKFNSQDNNSTFTHFLPTPDAANSGNPSTFRTRVYGRSSLLHVLQVDLAGSPFINDTTVGVYIKTHDQDYTGTLTNNIQVRYTPLGQTLGAGADNNNVCWLSLTYDRNTDLAGNTETRIEDWQNGSNAYFSFSNADLNTEGWVWDLKNHIRSRGTASGSTFNVVTGANSSPSDMVVVTDRALKTAELMQTSLANLSDPGNSGEFLIITNPRLIASAQAYKNYRDTNTVNQIPARIVTTDQIFDEFGYGSFTPVAIKRFMKWALDNWGTPPRYLLLWGKGQYLRRGRPDNMVPTWGQPASDYEYVSNWDPNIINPVPDIPVGRINIFVDDEGLDYLDKVIEYEHSPWEPWMKESVYLGGGKNINEQNPIKGYLVNGYMSQFENPPLGGKGWYFQNFNTSTESNSAFNSEYHINKGVQIIHFFGHSSHNIYDVDIKEPNLYQNYSRYPLVIAFGCYGGNFARTSKSYGERFVLERGRGSIGYFANSTAGYLGPLGEYGKIFYQVAFNTHLGERLGDVIQESHRRFHDVFKDPNSINHTFQLNLQGDPSITLYNPKKPDLAITESDIFFEPANFSASDSTFDMKIVTRNQALATQDSFYLSIRQTLPSGDVITYPSRKEAPISYLDTLTYTIRNTVGYGMAGTNYFDVFVDSTDLLDEIIESNNRVNKLEIIPGNIPAILYPEEYAVIGENKVSLSASSFVLNNSTTVRYVFEIDSVPEFNSPQFQSSGVVTGTSAFSDWTVPFTLRNGQVYYWRVRLADISPVVWAEASFKYIQDRRGWAQSRPPQFYKDPTQRIYMDKNLREWAFDTRSSEISVLIVEGEDAVYRLDNGVYQSKQPPTTINGIMYTPISHRTLVPGIQGINLGDWQYLDMPGASNALITEIANAEQGDYFLIASQRNASPHLWGGPLLSALDNIGVDTSAFRQLGNGDPFIILGRKGYSGSAYEVYAPNLYDSLTNRNRWSLQTVLNTHHSDGNIQSTQIGPSVDWEEMYWDWKSLDQVVQEKTLVSVYAVRNNNTDSLIYTGSPRGTYALSSLDASLFPYLRLEARAEDSAHMTAPQLEHWHVIHVPAPDAVIDPVVNYSFDRDTIQFGESPALHFGIDNVTDPDMDSMLVRYTLVRNDRSEVVLSQERYAPIPGQSRIEVDFSFETGNLNTVGNVSLRIEINPDNDQAELYQFNNIYVQPFHILEDFTNPILDVTFNGKRIMDGDIVSPQPEILMQINDENRYLAVNDTAFEIYFGERSFTGNNLQRVFISNNSEVEVVPATLPDNKARLYFRPGRLQDGEYTLQVQGFDATGNASGTTAYEINFEVVNQNAVSNVLNYPNPFSTSTRWVYTLTGDQVPDRFEISVYTISGKLVKVIDLAEMGEVRYGYNISDYSWDGRDEFGDLLANGVYIYKVTAKIGDQDMDIRDEGVTEYFKNNYGKLYIMR